MPSCKYCNEPMTRKNDHLKVSFYICPKCGSQGPSVKMDHLGWEKELDDRTLGLMIDVKTLSAEEDLRHRNAVLSARYSRLKSCELPNYSWIQRDVNSKIVALQNERSKMNKVKYLKELANLYKQKATYLEYKTKYENELSFAKHQIRVNKKKLDEIGHKADENKPLGREPTADEIGSPHIKFCRNCTTTCTLCGSDCFVLCGYFKGKA